MERWKLNAHSFSRVVMFPSDSGIVPVRELEEKSLNCIAMVRRHEQRESLRESERNKHCDQFGAVEHIIRNLS